MNSEKMTKGVNLVWTSRGLEEANWLRHLLGPLIRREVFAEQFEFVEPDNLYVVSANKNLHRSIPSSFLAALASVRRKGLIQLSRSHWKKKPMNS